jgi:hypothetical protein
MQQFAAGSRLLLQREREPRGRRTPKRAAPLPRQMKAHSGVDSATTENATYFTSSRLILDLSFLGFFFSRFGASLLPIPK